jgi:hypothetical protein
LRNNEDMAAGPPDDADEDFASGGTPVIGRREHLLVTEKG